MKAELERIRDQLKCSLNMGGLKGSAEWAVGELDRLVGSLPVSVPDGLRIAIQQRDHYAARVGALELGLLRIADDFYPDNDSEMALALGEMREAVRSLVAAAPTVKAEQVPTPEFVWVRLLEALAGDNGCPFTASTDDYREAKPALVQLIAAGFFRDDADSLDGDVWTIAAGEQSEAAARFASCADAYAVLSDVLNRVFERPEEDPSLPAAGSAVEEVDVVGWSSHREGRWSSWMHPTKESAQNHDRTAKAGKPMGATIEPLMTVVQHERIVAALSAHQSAPEWIDPVALTSGGITYDAGFLDGVAEAKRLNAPYDRQSAPERVSVPTDAELVEIANKLGALPELCFTEDHPEVRWRIRPEVRALARSLLASHGRGEA